MEWTQAVRLGCKGIRACVLRLVHAMHARDAHLRKASANAKQDAGPGLSLVMVSLAPAGHT